MNAAEIVAELDREIGRLQQVRALLTSSEPAPESKKRGRPKGSVNAQTDSGAVGPVKKRRGMSGEARERIAAPQRKRWAGQKGNAGARKAGKKAAEATP